MILGYGINMRQFFRDGRAFSVCSVWWLVASLSQITHAIPGQPGTLDSTWATLSTIGAGKAITPIGSGADSATAIALQPDGKVVVAGTCANGTFTAFCAVRYNANGTLDTAFGNNGTVITPVGSGASYATAIARQSDGKLVLAGTCEKNDQANFCALRYNANGSIDAGFGADGTGTAVTRMGPNSPNGSNASAVAIQPSGAIILVGACYGEVRSGFCALRYNSNGIVDTGFGSAGSVISYLGTSSSSGASAIALQPDGQMVLAGACSREPRTDLFNSSFCALRYSADGALDTRFGSRGAVSVAIGNFNDYARSVVIQSNGKAVISGSCVGFGDDFRNKHCAIRLNTNGALDSSFGNSGKIVTLAVDGYAYSLVLKPDDKLILAGGCDGRDYCALRYLSDGSPDVSFGTSGVARTRMTTTNGGVATAAALQPDGALLLAGSCSNGTNDDFCAARYDGDVSSSSACSLDIDGDNTAVATTDSLIQIRVSLGLTGDAVTSSINFAPSAQRKTWTAIRDYMVTNSTDFDGDGRVLPTTDALIHARILMGFTGDAVVNGIDFPVNATRKDWASINTYVTNNCGAAN
jgi:uncharacterized delta-60 repeat protein